MREFILFARTPRDEFLKAARDTELDSDVGSMLHEDGWMPVSEPPPPAFQIRNTSVDLDLVKNAEHAFRDGVTGYLAAYVDPDCLVGAVPSRFRAGGANAEGALAGDPIHMLSTTSQTIPPSWTACVLAVSH